MHIILFLCTFADRYGKYMMTTLAVKWKAFRQWQQRPYEVAQKSEERHCCATCGEVFQGNYCPRCGQSARIGRYSLKKALLLLLDVWGLGNRGMFRTLRDLLLRPGYLIRDYISGMQMAYFPPFKLLFLLTALLLVIESGVNLKDMTSGETTTEQTVNTSDDSAGSSSDHTTTKVNTTPKGNATTGPAREATEGEKQEATEDRDFEDVGIWIGEKTDEFSKNYPNVAKLLMLLVMSLFLYFLIRKSPAIPDLKFSEMLVAMVYIRDMISMYEIVLTFIGAPVYYSARILFLIIPLKQMTGFKWWKTILVVLLSYLYYILLLTAAVISGYYVIQWLE